MPRSRNRNFWLDPQAQDPEIHDHVEQIQIVDSHEHLDEERVRLEGPNNLTRFFLYYTFSDVVSAGLPDMPGGTFFNHGMSGEEQWTLIRNYWPLVKHSAFCRAVTLSIRELYDIEDLRDDTILPLLEAIAKKNQPGVTEWILREKCGIECSFINCEDPGDLARRTDHPGLFLPVLGVSAFCSDKMPIDKYQRSTGVSIASLKDWTRMIDWYFERWGGHVVSLKNVCGYWRSLHFENVAESEAGAVFEKWLLRGQSATETERRMLQDFNFHYCIRRAIDYGLPVQIHTGYHSGSNYMDLNLLWLRDLCNLFRDYPSARFVLIHTGYPEGQELIALCKHYRNVFADLSWTWAIDPEASMQFLRQAMVALPSNKLFGFGGDYGYADMVYGHSRIARDGTCWVLSEAVRRGLMSRPEAKELGSAWLRENAMSFFRIDEKRAAQAGGQPEPLAPPRERAAS